MAIILTNEFKENVLKGKVKFSKIKDTLGIVKANKLRLVFKNEELLTIDFYEDDKRLGYVPMNVKLESTANIDIFDLDIRFKVHFK